MIREFYHDGFIFLGRGVVVENESRYKADNQPPPVFLPVEFHGGGGWWAAVHGVAELNMTEATLHMHRRRMVQ